MNSPMNSALKSAFPSMLSAARALGFALGCVVLSGSLASCEMAGYNKRKKELKERVEKERKEEEEVAPKRRGLEVGEVIVHTFVIDNFWHPAPYAFGYDEVIDIKAHGASKALRQGVVQVRIGDSNMVVSKQSEFKVSEPGAVSFKVDPLRAGTYKGDCEVEITRKK